MVKWENEIAQHLKDRDNPDKIGAVTGYVHSLYPRKIGILNDSIFLDETNSKMLDTDKPINTGDNVLIITSESNNNYFIVGRLI